MRNILLVILICGWILDVEARGKRKKQTSGKRARAMASDDKGPIEVHGQTRNLNMLLTLQNEDDAINFIKLRKNYTKEIKRQKY
jgi:hypothetical protein